MWPLLQIILPVCLLILVGFLASKIGIVKKGADEIIGDFVFKIAIPCLLFRLIVTADLAGIQPWSIWFAYFSGVLAVWLLAAFLLPFLFKREILYGVIGSVSSGFSNTVMIAIPVILQAFGEQGMVPISILLSIHLPFLLFLTTAHHDVAQWIDGEGGIEGQSFVQKVQKFVLSIIKNHILIGIFLGGLVRLAGLELPALVLNVTGQISGIAGPMALIILGMGLTRYGFQGNIGPALMTTFLKLVVLPFFVLLSCHFVFQLSPVFTASLVVAAASPAGVNAYLFAQHFGTGQALSSNSISLSTPLCIVTMTFWLGILKFYII